MYIYRYIYIYTYIYIYICIYIYIYEYIWEALAPALHQRRSRIFGSPNPGPALGQRRSPVPIQPVNYWRRVGIGIDIGNFIIGIGTKHFNTTRIRISSGILIPDTSKFGRLCIKSFLCFRFLEHTWHLSFTFCVHKSSFGNAEVSMKARVDFWGNQLMTQYRSSVSWLHGSLFACQE